MRFRLVTEPDLLDAWDSVWVGGDEATDPPKNCPSTVSAAVRWQQVNETFHEDTMSGIYKSDAVRLNQGCACITLDRKALGRALDSEAGESGFSQRLIAAHSCAVARLLQCPCFPLGRRAGKNGGGDRGNRAGE